VLRSTTATQTLDLEHGGTFSAENVEDALDKNCKLNINQADQLDRALRAPDTDAGPPAPATRWSGEAPTTRPAPPPRVSPLARVGRACNPPESGSHGFTGQGGASPLRAGRGRRRRCLSTPRLPSQFPSRQDRGRPPAPAAAPAARAAPPIGMAARRAAAAAAGALWRRAPIGRRLGAALVIRCGMGGAWRPHGRRQSPPPLAPAPPSSTRLASTVPVDAVYGGPSTPAANRVTLRTLRQKHKAGERIAMVTAYDYPSATHVRRGDGEGVREDRRGAAVDADPISQNIIINQKNRSTPPASTSSSSATRSEWSCTATTRRCP